MEKQKAVPLDVLERLLGPVAKPTAPAEPPTVLEALVLAAEGKPAARPTISQALAELLANPTATEPAEPCTASHIVDRTAEAVEHGLSFIITGVKKPSEKA